MTGKYRAYDLQNKAWVPNTQMSLGADGTLYISDDFQDMMEAPPDVVKLMFSTGLHDKNGKEIFEGDILLCGDSNEEHEDFKTEVWFHKGRFLTRHFGFPVSSWAENDNGRSWCEVLGNIHEHPHLLANEVSPNHE